MRPHGMQAKQFLYLAAAGLLTVSCSRRDVSPAGTFSANGIEFTAAEAAQILKLTPLPDLPHDPRNRHSSDARAVALGRQLFYDPRLSANGSISCATCHDPSRHWTDGKRVAEGLGRVARNTPTLWNVAYNRWQFWDGRRDTLWAQSVAPIENVNEMGSNRLRIYWRVAEEPGMRRAYEDLFGSLPALDSGKETRDARPVAEDPRHPMHRAWLALTDADRDRVNRCMSNLGKAVEAFERTMITPEAAFDRFGAGLRRRDQSAMDSMAPAALRGLRLFIGRGQCVLCHSGPNFTDREFHNIGLDRGAGELDTGRFRGIEAVKADEFNGNGVYSDDLSLTANIALHYVAQQPNNLGEFKTPTLRNVARTAPYMHDGRFADLRAVLSFYSRLDQQPAIGHREESLRPLNLSARDMDDLIAFLESLANELPGTQFRPPGP
ncbi:MAG: cytochrome-c peroxidase [Verrucomicrobia bacterium]|nr:cytochrome-c peroxidase [Verrucomicrobiota bacterium]